MDKEKEIKAEELNFDGLVGPTHNYAGLAYGNTASFNYANHISNPKDAALQGLEKMHLLMRQGITQAVLPPQHRPNLAMLKNLGFSGSADKLIQNAFQKSPEILAACYSASSMWAANAATVSPSIDSTDGLCHITPANLVTFFHREQESQTTYRIFKKIFSDERKFKIHPPLPSSSQFNDEGAANHIRLCEFFGSKGLEIFIYGRKAFSKEAIKNLHYPVRQTLEAQQAIVRRHALSQEKVLFAKQNLYAIEQGVFHNDVISVGNQNVFLYHEEAFENTKKVLEWIEKNVEFTFYGISVSRQEFSIQDAVKSYLFNSQLITKKDGSMFILAPEECRDFEPAHRVLSRIVDEDNPIKSFNFINCRQSMQNGGGPACLRLRVVLTPEEKKSCLASVFLDEVLYERLVGWVKRHYRDRIAPADLQDPELMRESAAAITELNEFLGLSDANSFQTEVE